MGSLVDWLACVTLNFDENVASSENKSFSWNACSFAQKSDGKKPDENEKEKPIIIQLFSFDVEPSFGLQWV